jgi:Ca2+-binding RTX toxin-like protein
MKNRKRLNAKRALRLASAAAVAAAVAGAAGIVAQPGIAAPTVKASTAPQLASNAALSSAQLSDGLLTVTGTAANDKIALRLKAGHPGILQVDIGDNGTANFSLKRSTITAIAVHARAGNDQVRIDETNGTFTDTIPTTLAGGNGRDTLIGGSGAETLRGGQGNDSIDGNAGNDLALLGGGDDTFVWDPGDGSDTVEGGRGADTMRFNGASVAEHIDLSANGSRLRLVRDVGAVTMDTAGVERVDVNAIGGADVVTVNNLIGTGVTDVNVDLAGTLGGSTGDGEADRVIVNATNGVDAINVNGDAGGVKVTRLTSTVEILHPEAANDRLEINTLDGRDSVDSGGLAAGTIQLFVDGVLRP